MGLSSVLNIFATDPHAGRDFNFSGTVDIQAAESGAGGLPRLRMVANTGQAPMILAGFRYPVVIDMQGVEFAKQKTPIISDHDPKAKIGHTLAQSASVETGIVAEGVVSASGQAAKDFVADSKNDFPHEMSVGARAKRTEFVADGKPVTVNGTTFKGPLIISRQTLIREFTVTTLGADVGTSAALAASELTEQENIMATENQLQADREAAAAEFERREKIGEIFAQYEGIANVEDPTTGNVVKASTFRANAIRKGLDPLKVEVALMKAGLDGGAGQGPAIQVRRDILSQDDIASEVLQCAAMRSMGVPQSAENPHTGQRAGWEHQFGERVLEAADSKEMRDISLHQMMQCTIREYTGSYYGGNLKTDAFIAAYNSAAMNLVASGGGFSTLTVQHILENVANKMLLTRFQLSPATWPLWCEQKNLVDFKPAALYRLDANLGYLPLNPQGELVHGKLVDSKRTIQADTHGRMISLDRHHIINDDLDAFRQIINGLGDGAIWALEAAAHATLLGNAGNFFHDDNGNLITDVLGMAGLEAAEVAFDSHVGEGGKPIMANAEVLLTGTALAVTARNLYTQTTLLGVDANAAQIGIANTYQGRFRPVKSKYIDVTGIRQPDGTAIPNQSATKWFLLAGATQGSAVCVGLLNGRAVPTIQSAETAFNRLGMDWRGFHDFGTAQGDPQHAVMSTGAGG